MQETAHQLIKSGSAKLHKRAEEVLAAGDIFRGTMSPAAYRCLLQTHAVVLGEVIEAFAKNDSSDTAPFVKMIKDLHRAATLDTKDDQAAPLPDFADPLQVTGRPARLGSLYVLLGATHGSRMIYPRLQANTVLGSRHNYYAASASVPVSTWSSFLQLLNSELVAPSDIASGLRSVNMVFERFIQVYQRLTSN